MATYSITAMKEMNSAAGKHWFDKDTMRFFGTKIETRPNTRNMFITSELHPVGVVESGSGRTIEVRRYTIRQFDPATGGVDTVGGFGAYATLEKAREERDHICRRA